MSPFNRAGSVSEISRRHSFLCKNMDGMCLCERPGWPGFRDLGFWDRDVGDLDDKTSSC